MSGERKYATVDGKLVAEGHPDARFVASNTAGEVDDEFVARLKEAAGKPAKSEADASGSTVEKAAAKPADKAVRKAGNK